MSGGTKSAGGQNLLRQRYCCAICLRMFPKAMGPPNFRRHMNSGRYVSNNGECIVRSSRIMRLQQLHILSTLLSVCPSRWIDKMEGVIDRVVYASRCCGELITCTPFITVHYCSRQDILSYDGMQCRCIPTSYFHKKAVSSSLYPSKDPVTVNKSSSIIFTFTELAFIDFCFFSWTANGGWIV